MTDRICSTCKVRKSNDNFLYYLDKRYNIFRYRARCKDCCNQAYKIWAKERRPLLYYIWASMKQRCFDKDCKAYKDYGGRGIGICDRWLKFENFNADMLDTYKEGLTIDRINNNSNYSKENCRWATQKEQANNTRSTERAKRITFNGKTLTIATWA